MPAIKKILTTLNEKGGFQQLIPIFEGMNLDGSRAIGVLSSMASSIDKINEAQLLANQSMADGTSIINEYNVKKAKYSISYERFRVPIGTMVKKNINNIFTLNLRHYDKLRKTTIKLKHISGNTYYFYDKNIERIQNEAGRTIVAGNIIELTAVNFKLQPLK